VGLGKQFQIGQHRKEKIIKDYLEHFPYLTIGEEYIPVIQALINSTKYVEKQSQLPIQQFPCIFMRESEINYPMIQKFTNTMYRIIRSNENKIPKLIYEIIKILCKEETVNSMEMVEELVCKAVTQIKFITLPETEF
jgi:hypothetical protein